MKASLRPLALLALAWALFAPAPLPAGEPAENDAARRAVARAADRYGRHLQENDVWLRVRLGLPIVRLPDLSLAKARADAAFGRSLAAELRGIDAAELPHSDALSLAILRREAEELEAAERFYWLRLPATPYFFSFLGAHAAFTEAPFRDQSDLDRYLALLARYPEFLRALAARLSAQARRGIRIGKPELPLVVGVFRSARQDPEKSLFRVAPGRLEAIPPAARARFTRRVAALIRERINPRLDRVLALLSGDYAKRAPEGVGLSQYPGGADYYAFLVRRETTLSLSPDEIHRIGLEEVQKLNAALDLARARAGFAGTLEEFRRFLRTDPRFFAKTPAEVGERLLAAQNRILPRIPEFFGATPRAPFSVKRLEPELEGAMTFGYYQFPTKADPKGYYKYNGSKLSERSILGAASLIAHELVPGHHFQLNLQYENESLPMFRRNAGYNAFIEGWGEYAASVAGEMGMYGDPYDLAGRVVFDLFLTSRLVVDTGMNALGWSRERAIEFLRKNTLVSEEEIATETLRYACDIPAQALGYKLGSRTIRALRERAEKELGPAFDVRRFHDAVLLEGALPLDVLEEHVAWFIAQEKERAGKTPRR